MLLWILRDLKLENKGWIVTSQHFSTFPKVRFCSFLRRDNEGRCRQVAAKLAPPADSTGLGAGTGGIDLLSPCCSLVQMKFNWSPVQLASIWICKRAQDNASSTALILTGLGAGIQWHWPPVLDLEVSILVPSSTEPKLNWSPVEPQFNWPHYRYLLELSTEKGFGSNFKLVSLFSATGSYKLCCVYKFIWNANVVVASPKILV